ncbi:unnamed protein product [Arctogadus glacialis]
MQPFRASRLLLILLMQIPVQSSQAEPNPKVLFLDLWNRSLCHLMEQLVEVSQEHPATGMGYIYHPACVPLWRCAGCCSDENLECHPLVTQNTTMQLLRISPSEKSWQYVGLSFTEHLQCECRPRPKKRHDDSYSQSIMNRSRGRKKRKRAKTCGWCQEGNE